jgi:hypothetical protein
MLSWDLPPQAMGTRALNVMLWGRQLSGDVYSLNHPEFFRYRSTSVPCQNLAGVACGLPVLSIQSGLELRGEWLSQ